MESSPPRIAQLSIVRSPDSTLSFEAEMDAELKRRLEKGKFKAEQEFAQGQQARVDSGVSVESAKMHGEDEVSELPTDPALAFPVELFLHILRFLATPSSLSRVALVSRSWNKAANDSALWTEMTRQLWDGKVYIPDKFREMLNDDPKGAYRDSWKDSKRDVITAEELCSFEWQWRFKEAAGEHFTEEDPWWAGEAPRRRIYKPDGTMGGHIYRPDARWRFVNNAQGKLGELGRFVRVANTPASVFSRHSNWGWFMESCWSVATAFPLPPKGADPELEDDALKVDTNSMKYEVLCYNSGIAWPDSIVMDRAGFEKVCRRVGLNLGLFRRAGWDSDEEDDIGEEGEAEHEGSESGEEADGDEEAWETTDEGVESGHEESEEDEEHGGSDDGDDNDDENDDDDSQGGFETATAHALFRVLLRDVRRARDRDLANALAGDGSNNNNGESSGPPAANEDEDDEEDGDFVPEDEVFGAGSGTTLDEE